MKVELKTLSFENIKIQNTSLEGANFVKCDLSGSQVDNIIISGMKLNGAKLYNCIWKNLRINEIQKSKGMMGMSIKFALLQMGIHQSLVDMIIQLGCGIYKQEIKSLYQKQTVSTKLASCSDDFLYIWNHKTGKSISKLIGHTNKVYSVCFSPDGTKLPSSSSDTSIRIWDVKTGKEKVKLNGHKINIYSVCFSPDSTTLVSDQIRWSYQLCLFSLFLSPDGKTLASSSSDKSIRLWNVQTGLQKATLNVHNSTVSSVCFSPDGTLQVSGI
ncbi:unnamed protein product (macronuclear) [Paramecium tetraurelia]|uniref:Uncharacterized protein n=1 Tax=Paramecium tetraurelia TaxID=5888 RepID=A0DII6_PARTE|nr:uncharacterized protein GSPATT00039517001 [Paramecium tetraurelia]CAK82853.1 unnamed protein product [Paramecium tetraurelia]|eukprot:XP_001450250.1 hypothetical protein (macronuclear) [Paramecium tetraurelia strain d4-2]